LGLTTIADRLSVTMNTHLPYAARRS